MNKERKNEPPFLSENSALYNLIGELGEQRKRAEVEGSTARHDMKELTLSLTCLRGLTRILERPELEFDTAIQEILDLIPQAWQYPDETAARITYEGREYKTSNFIVETNWRQASDILVGGEPKGLFEIYYLEDTPPDFTGMQMWQNRDLIEAFACGIGLLFERSRLSGELDRRADIIRKGEDKNKHNTARLSKAIAKLRSLKEQRDETEHRMHWLLARISSELRTMLVGMANIAGRGLESAADETGEPLRQIKAEAELVIRITNRIYDYANISNGRFRHNNTEFRLRDVVENAVDQFSEQARAKGIDPIVMVDPFVPDRVIGDGNRLSQILTYLMENALTRSGGGEIIVRVNVEVSAHMLPVFHFVVIDSGAGIIAESGGHLFDVCSDGVDSLASGNLHARLGTAIARHMVEILGGEIWIEERKDDTEGNEIHFTMWLDVAKGRQDKNDGNESEILTGAKVLVADGSQTYRELYCLMLEYWGAEPTLVSSGREALERLEKTADTRSPYNVVIVDAALPDMDGYKIVEQMRADNRTETSGIIMTFSGNRAPDTDRPETADISAAMNKPIRQAALQEILATVIREKTKSEEADAVETENPESLKKDRGGSPKHSNENNILLTDFGTDSHRAMAAKLLRKRGYVVSTAKNGREMLERIDSGEHDIAFMDIPLPDMNGLEAVESIRRSEKDHRPHLPIIAIMPGDEDSDRQELLGAGVDDVLDEPIAFTRLFEMIETYCGRSRVSDESDDEQPHNLIRFDREKALAVVGGDPDMLTDIIEIFEDDCAAFLAALDGSLTSSDFGKVIEVAANIREAAENVGAMRISKIGEQLAALSLPDSRDRAQQFAASLHEEFAEFRKIADSFARTTLA